MFDEMDENNIDFEEYDDAMDHLASSVDDIDYEDEFQEFDNLIIDESRPFNPDDLDKIADQEQEA